AHGASAGAQRLLDHRARRRPPADRDDRDPAPRRRRPRPRGARDLLGALGAMRITIWGVRGSLASPGADTARYGGNTACVEVRGAGGGVLVLDAGTGIRRLGASLPAGLRRVDVLLTHLHMDHIQGLGFFAPLFDGGLETHL